MYAQQAASPQSSTQQSSSEQTSSGWQTMAAGTDSQQATSNQALLEDAGIAQQEGEGDSMLGMVLECLPLEAAVPMAAAHIEDAGVQAWARQQDLISVAKVAARWRPDLLQAQWPAGVGLSMHGTLGAELGLGGDVDTTFQVLRQDDGSFAVTSRSEFGVDLGKDTAGLSLLVSGVDPELVNGVAATLGVGVGVNFDGTAMLTGTELLLAGLGTLAAPMLVTPFLSGAVVLDFVDDAGWLNIRDHVALPDMETEVRAFSELEGQTRAGLSDVAPLPGVLGAVSDTVGVLIESLRALADLKGSRHVEVIGGSGAFALHIEDSTSGMLDLPGCELLANVLDSSLMAAAAERFGAHTKVSLYLPVYLGDEASGLQTEPDGASLTVELGAAHGETAETDSLCLPLRELAGFLGGGGSGLAGGLAEMLNSVELSRAVELPADPSMVDNVMATFLGTLTDAYGGASVVGGIDTLRLTGKLTAQGETMSYLAQAGIQAPPELGAASALRDIHDALCGAAANTGAMADWLRPWAGVITDAAQTMTLEAPRLKGELLVGAGGSASVSMVEGASGKLRGTIGLVIDQPADEAGDAQVREALARGAFRDEAAPAAEPEQAVDEGECEQPVEEQVCEQEADVTTQDAAEQGAAEQGAAEQEAAEQTSTAQAEQAPAPEEAEQTQTVEQSTEHADSGTETATTDAADKNGKHDEASAHADDTVKDSTDKNGKAEREQPFQLPRALRRFQRRTDIGAPKQPTRRS